VKENDRVTRWVRFEHEGAVRIGALSGDDEIELHDGDLFASPVATGRRVPLAAVRLLVPCVPGKIVGLWNNSRSSAEKQGLSEPAEPLFFLKPSSALVPDGGVIRRPKSYEGAVLYEAELGVVIGRTCKDADAEEAARCIFGYTCVNDVTAFPLIAEDPTFAQWTRAKAFDTFLPLGPAIATGIDLTEASVRATLQGRVRQDYKVSDLFKQPPAIVSALSRCMTLEAGDVIACGTGPGSLPMRPGSTIAISIDGVGTLTNTYET